MVAAASAAIACTGTAPTVIGFAICVAATTAAEMLLAERVLAGIYVAEYVLDCYLDIYAPEPTGSTTGPRQGSFRAS